MAQFPVSTMTGSKPWYQSTGVLGALVALLCVPLSLMGIHLSSEDMAALSRELTSIAAGVGGVMALIGRLKASQGIVGPVSPAASGGVAGSEEQVFVKSQAGRASVWIPLVLAVLMLALVVVMALTSN